MNHPLLRYCASLLLVCMGLANQAVVAQTQNWFEFRPQNDFRAGHIGLAHWLDAPAGKHGFVQMQGRRLVFEDGTPVQFWGVNIGNEGCYPEASQADALANYWAKYGINGVRLHKFTWDEHKGDSSTVMNDTFWQRFDYFQQQLRVKGIYSGWSHIYGHRVRPADQARLLNYQEIKNLTYPWAHLSGSTSALVNFAPDLQDLSIELTVNMLKHRNPYTQRRYADDPALSFIELQNEDNIFWSAIGESLKQAPTYRRLLCQLFAEWLKAKYQTEANLRSAWGENVLKPGEGIAQGGVYPEPNHGLFSWEYETAFKEKRPIKRHILDKITFLYEQQSAFYERFTKAIRATGYRGTIVGSCWQAGSGIAHYYNLYADYQVGIIDRHNYFGGDTGHQLQPGKVNAQSMLEAAGSGLLSSGLQQVTDRPFALSEWINTMPNEWIAEGAPLVAMYGMGLQGWDASYEFASNRAGFSKGLSSDGGGVYNTDSPLQMGLYPALARMIYRRDIHEAEVIATRNVHVPSLAQGQLGFQEKVSQQFDVKEFDGDVPAKALAVGRTVVAFTESFRPTAKVDLSGYHDERNHLLTATTKQLQWHYGKQPYVVLNTPASKAVVGFAADQKHDLNECSLSVTTPFAVILITATEKDKILKTSKKWLITAVARARNTNMSYNETGTQLLQKGVPPLLLEPVDFTLTLLKERKAVLRALDHDGIATLQQQVFDGRVIAVKGERWKTMYYTLSFSK
jgi:hypothetical protein